MPSRYSAHFSLAFFLGGGGSRLHQEVARTSPSASPSPYSWLHLQTQNLWAQFNYVSYRTQHIRCSLQYGQQQQLWLGTLEPLQFVTFFKESTLPLGPDQPLFFNRYWEMKWPGCEVHHSLSPSRVGLIKEHNFISLICEFMERKGNTLLLYWVGLLNSVAASLVLRICSCVNTKILWLFLCIHLVCSSFTRTLVFMFYTSAEGLKICCSTLIF